MIILDGGKEAEKVASFLEESERLLGKSLLIIQCNGHSEESLYVRLKREMGERLGVLVTVLFARNIEEVKEMIQDANQDETIDGVLVQLPVVGATREETEQVLCSINTRKDVDGLNPKSSFIPAVVRAVERVFDIFKISRVDKVAVVGSKGWVGRRLMTRLVDLGYIVFGLDKDDDLTRLKEVVVVVSSTGVRGVVGGEMVPDGFVGVDLGYPKGDFSVSALAKADMITPVPNGVGPLTVVSLFENLAEG